MSSKLRKPPLERFDPDAAVVGEEGTGVFGLPFKSSECSVLLFGYPWEPTTSYGQGTAHGPRAICQASAQLDLFDLEMAGIGLACPYKHGIYMVHADAELQMLNVEATQCAKAAHAGRDEAVQKMNQLSAQFNERVQREVSEFLSQGRLIGLIGGDHSVPFGAICAHAQRERDFGILHVDAHADLRVAYEGFEHSHASIMHNVLEACPTLSQLVQVGIRDLSEAEYQRIEQDPRITTFFGPQLAAAMARGEGWDALCQQIIAKLPQRVYVSVDIDGLDPSYCPHTGTPVPGGLQFEQLQQLLLALAKSGKEVIGFDLCEVAPPTKESGEIRCDSSRDEWDANVGARVLYRLCGVLLHAQGARD